VAARSPVSDNVAQSARTARATGQSAPSLPETPLVVSFLCTVKTIHRRQSPLLFVCRSHLAATYFIFLWKRETLFRVSLDRPEHFDFSIAQQEESGDMLAILLGLFRLIWLFGRSQDAVALENLTLRQQVAIYKRKKKRPRLIRRDC
jgi:hypothetical protein